MRVRLSYTEDIAKNIRTFWFSAEPMPRYSAGQFIELRLRVDKPDERGDKHWFTLSSSPSEDKLSITTKFAAGLSSSFKTTLRELKAGDGVNMSEPMGDFVLPKDKNIPLIFVAAGIGVTPMRSMVRWLSDTGERRNIHLIYGAKTLEEVAFRGLFESYGLKFDIVLSEPPRDWHGLTGHLSADRIIGLTGGLNDKLTYLSGPEPMVEKINDDLKAKGLTQKHILTDFFPGYTKI